MMAPVLALTEDGLRELPGLLKVPSRDPVRGHLARLRRGAQHGRHGLRVVVAARIVMRQQRGLLEAALRGFALQERPDALVQLATLLQEQALVGHLLRETLA